MQLLLHCMKNPRRFSALPFSHGLLYPRVFTVNLIDIKYNNKKKEKVSVPHYCKHTDWSGWGPLLVPPPLPITYIWSFTSLGRLWPQSHVYQMLPWPPERRETALLRSKCQKSASTLTVLTYRGGVLWVWWQKACSQKRGGRWECSWWSDNSCRRCRLPGVELTVAQRGHRAPDGISRPTPRGPLLFISVSICMCVCGVCVCVCCLTQQFSDKNTPQ